MKPDSPLENALGVLRRRKWVVLIALVCVPLVAFLAASSKDKEYTATATLLFESGEEGFGVEATRTAATNEVLAGLPVIAVRTAEDLDGKVSPGEILESVKAGSVNEQANLTTISATTHDPALSATIANAYSRAYIEFRGETAQKGLNQEITEVEDEIEALSASESEGIRGEKLRERLDALELEKALRSGKTSLVQPAGVPTSPSSPKVKRDVVVGIVVGLLLGLVLAAALERIDRRVRSVEELERRFRLPLLAEVPRARAFERGSLQEMLQVPEAEAFRTLRGNLRYFNADAARRSFLIASPEPADGKSTVARGLAGAMAELGDDVVLVEADLRKESKIAGSRARQGLSKVLLGQSLDDALVDVPVGDPSLGKRYLRVLPSGPVPPNPTELLESDAMARLMEELHERFELIVIDSPALGFVSDALALVPLSTEIIAIGAVGRSDRNDIDQFNKHLEITGHKPIGLVATMTKFDRTQYSYYMRSRATTG
ncbi:MAG TPA: polysaccharide biosynthesis tyrosine autokinase [Solirubrobacterales bacterium]|nr:polysaccharide biosynthesis tyrosine autokinase [Solirubrobacterales bacterium]